MSWDGRPDPVGNFARRVVWDLRIGVGTAVTGGTAVPRNLYQLPLRLVYHRQEKLFSNKQMQILCIIRQLYFWISCVNFNFRQNRLHQYCRWCYC